MANIVSRRSTTEDGRRRRAWKNIFRRKQAISANGLICLLPEMYACFFRGTYFGSRKLHVSHDQEFLPRRATRLRLGQLIYIFRQQKTEKKRDFLFQIQKVGGEAFEKRRRSLFDDSCDPSREFGRITFFAEIV